MSDEPPPPASPLKRVRTSAAFDALPAEMIECIVSFAPVRARLRCLSFVSKQWRAAVLRSVTHLRLAGPTADHVNSAVALFPRLAALRLACPLAPLALPAALTELRWATGFPPGHPEEDPSVANWWLTAHFPRLARFSLRDRVDYRLPQLLLTAFTLRHRASLTRLSVCAPHDPHLAALADAGMPHVRRLSINVGSTPDALSMLCRAFPALTTLSLATQDKGIMRAPPSQLSALTRLELKAWLDKAAQERLPEWLSQLPALRNFIGTPTSPAPPHLLTHVSLAKTDDWTAIAAIGAHNLRSVCCRICWAGEVSANVPLPHLRTATLYLSSAALIQRTAVALLRTYRTLVCLTVGLEVGCCMSPQEAAELFPALVEEGLRCGLRKLVVPRGVCALPTVAKLGWIEVAYQ